MSAVYFLAKQKLSALAQTIHTCLYYAHRCTHSLLQVCRGWVRAVNISLAEIARINTKYFNLLGSKKAISNRPFTPSTLAYAHRCAHYSRQVCRVCVQAVNISWAEIASINSKCFNLLDSKKNSRFNLLDSKKTVSNRPSTHAYAHRCTHYSRQVCRVWVQAVNISWAEIAGTNSVLTFWVPDYYFLTFWVLKNNQQWTA